MICPSNEIQVDLVIRDEEHQATENACKCDCTLPIADRTTQGSSFGKLHIMDATSRILSAFATDEPPNFMTTLSCRKVKSSGTIQCLNAAPGNEFEGRSGDAGAR